MWNQTLIIEHIRLFGDPDTVEQNPPPVILELFDKDQVVSNMHSFCFVNLVFILKKLNFL